MCQDGVTPQLKSHLWRIALQPILTYAMDCLPLCGIHIRTTEMLQAKLVKASLGLSKYLRTTPLLNAMSIHKIESQRDAHSVQLFKSIMLNDSRSKDFYMHLLRINFQGNTLYSRVKNICDKNVNFGSIPRLLLDDQHTKTCVKRLKAFPAADGVIDSCKTLLSNFTANNKNILRMLLMPNM